MVNPNFKYEDGVVSLKINDKWIQPCFKQYEDIKPVGEPGANGVVLKATHKITKRVDAIKIWLPRNRNGRNEVREEQYLAEVQKIAKLKDPRIATIHDAWIENGCYCCSMEYIDGITYEKWLEKNHSGSKRIEKLIKIFEVINLYQSKGIIHGDIHSKNILIDRNEAVHIIDFGTSSLSSYAEQSVHRENYLMYELVEKTLETAFNKDAFLFKKYQISGMVTNDDDVRNAISIFFSSSVLCYLHLLCLLAVDKDIINNSRSIYDYCRTIAKGDYLNLGYFYAKVTGDNDRKLELFTQIMYEALEDEMFENAQEDFSEADRMEYLSLFSYYEFVKSLKNSNNIIEEDISHFIDSKISDRIKGAKNIFTQSGNLFEFHNNLHKLGLKPEEVQSIESDLRVVLYRLIEEKCGERLLHMLREIKYQISVLKQDDGQCERIVQLSYNYCLNNGIKYNYMVAPTVNKL